MSEKLYNNIILPDNWPPKYSIDTLKQKQPVPYLDNPPEVIDITVGRQLFVDDFLIRDHNLYFTYYRAKKYEGNPVFYPQTDIEKNEKLPLSSPKDGGVWYDKDEKKYKMWYEAGWLHKNAYAESDDGINWERPNLHVVEGTNEILPERDTVKNLESPTYYRPDSTTVVIDYDTDKKDEKYKLFLRNPGGKRPAMVGVSGDGIHFGKFRFTDECDDRSTIFYNPFRKKWVYSIRTSFANRSRSYAECDDLLEGAKWGDSAVEWLCADENMPQHPYTGTPTGLYNFGAVAYESIMLGLYEVYYGPDNKICFKTGAPKITELIPVYSRDGFHFSKPTNKAIVQASMTEDSWDRGYVQSVGGICTVTKDEIRIYYSGVAGDPSKGGTGNPNDCQYDWMYGNGACGFATLRRDGFVSIGHNEGDGVLKTRKLTFSGKKNHFFINAVTKTGGVIKATIFDADQKELASSLGFTGDSTCAELDFGDFNLSALENTTFTINFYIGNAQLYSFWFSESEDGASGGYDGAGGPIGV